MGSSTSIVARFSRLRGHEEEEEPAEGLRDILRASLQKAMVGTSGKAVQDGKDFYKFLFSVHPQLKKHFFGTEDATDADIQDNKRFEKQGQRLLMAVHVLASSIDNSDAFAAYAREIVNKHIEHELSPSLWGVFFGVFALFLKNKGQLAPGEGEAWVTMGQRFDDIAQDHLQKLGLPTFKRFVAMPKKKK